MELKLWILPNREQEDSILCFDGKSVRPLRDLFPVSARPKGWGHGIPSELLEGKNSDLVLYGYKSNLQDGDQCLFVCASNVRDRTGRKAHIGFLLVAKNPTAELIPSTDGLSDTERMAANEIVTRLRRNDDPWARSVTDLILSPPVVVAQTNVSLSRATFPHHSQYDVVDGMPVKKKSKAMMLLILALLAASVGLALWLWKS